MMKNVSNSMRATVQLFVVVAQSEKSLLQRKRTEQVDVFK